MNRHLTLSAIAAALITATATLPASAQQSPTGQSSGSYGRVGIPGQIVPEQRAYLRDYVGRQRSAPVEFRAPLSAGTVVPDAVELESFPEAVYGEVPSMRDYRYFSTGRNVVLVDPRTRQVYDVID